MNPKQMQSMIKTIMEKTSWSEEEAKAALEKTGDLADAIMELT